MRKQRTFLRLIRNERRHGHYPKPRHGLRPYTGPSPYAHSAISGRGSDVSDETGDFLAKAEVNVLAGQN